MNKKNIISKITACLLAVILLLSNATQDVYAQDSSTSTYVTFNVNLNLQSFSPELLSEITTALVNIYVTSATTGEQFCRKQINLREYISEEAHSVIIPLGGIPKPGVYGNGAVYHISAPIVYGADGNCYDNNDAPLGIDCPSPTVSISPKQVDYNQYTATVINGLAVYPKRSASVPTPPAPTTPGEYDQDNNNDTNPPQIEVTFTKDANYQVQIPLALKLSPKEIKSEDVIEAYDKEKTQQTPTLTDITEQVAGKIIWYNSFPIQAKGLIDASSVIKVEPSNFTLTAEDGDTASAITKANVTDLSATSVKFKNPLNADITDAYELPNDYDTTQTATGFIWVDDDDIDSASVYTGTMNFTITLEPNS